MESLNQAIHNLRELTLISVLVRMLLAVLCAGMVGIERGRKKRAAGFRTYILVCLGATIAVLTNFYLIKTYNSHADPARLGAQVINGIGFLGIGSIIVSRSKRVMGLTTAAGLWGCACIGLAIGSGFYEVALIGCSLIFVSMTLLHKLENRMNQDSRIIDLFIEVDEKRHIQKVINYLRSLCASVSSIQIASSKDHDEKNIALIISLKFSEKLNHSKFVEQLMGQEEILFVNEIENS